jgi:hypothetical protein
MPERESTAFLDLVQQAENHLHPTRMEPGRIFFATNSMCCRRSPKRVALSSVDRLVFVGLHRAAPEVLDALTILQPETVIRWHRAGFRTYWRWKSGRRVGRPKIPADVRKLMLEMSGANHSWVS